MSALQWSAALALVAVLGWHWDILGPGPEGILVSMLAAFIGGMALRSWWALLAFPVAFGIAAFARQFLSSGIRLIDGISIWIQASPELVWAFAGYALFMLGPTIAAVWLGRRLEAALTRALARRA
ncbi:MAG: hypothetical protein QJR03_05350 [Sphaerobacter sp.]|nr:hypothetical protein [Sphaerobacter sp.]